MEIQRQPVGDDVAPERAAIGVEKQSAAERPLNSVAMLFFIAMLLNGFPVATSSTMWPGLGGVAVVAVAQFSLVLTGLLFPHGRMRTRWRWLALAIALVTLWRDIAVNMGWWWPVSLTALQWMGMTATSLLSLLVAIVAQYRLTHEVIAGRRVDPDEVRRWFAAWTPPDLPEKTLDRDRRDPLFPVHVPLKAGGERGWPLVGRRPDHSVR